MPKVGLFFVVNRKPFVEGIPWTENPSFSGFRTYPVGHPEFWSRLQDLGAVRGTSHMKTCLGAGRTTWTPPAASPFSRPVHHQEQDIDRGNHGRPRAAKGHGGRAGPALQVRRVPWEGPYQEAGKGRLGLLRRSAEQHAGRGLPALAAYFSAPIPAAVLLCP